MRGLTPCASTHPAARKHATGGRLPGHVRRQNRRRPACLSPSPYPLPPGERGKTTPNPPSCFDKLSRLGAGTLLGGLQGAGLAIRRAQDSSQTCGAHYIARRRSCAKGAWFVPSPRRGGGLGRGGFLRVDAMRFNPSGRPETRHRRPTAWACLPPEPSPAGLPFPLSLPLRASTSSAGSGQALSHQGRGEKQPFCAEVRAASIQSAPNQDSRGRGLCKGDMVCPLPPAWGRVRERGACAGGRHPLQPLWPPGNTSPAADCLGMSAARTVACLPFPLSLPSPTRGEGKTTPQPPPAWRLP